MSSDRWVHAKHTSVDTIGVANYVNSSGPYCGCVHSRGLPLAGCPSCHNRGCRSGSPGHTCRGLGGRASLKPSCRSCHADHVDCRNCCDYQRDAYWPPPCRRRSVSHIHSRDHANSNLNHDRNHASCNCFHMNRVCRDSIDHCGLGPSRLCLRIYHTGRDCLFSRRGASLECYIRD